MERMINNRKELFRKEEEVFEKENRGFYKLKMI